MSALRGRGRRLLAAALILLTVLGLVALAAAVLRGQDEPLQDELVPPPLAEFPVDDEPTRQGEPPQDEQGPPAQPTIPTIPTIETPLPAQSPPPAQTPPFLDELDARGGIAYQPEGRMRVGERYEVQARIAAAVDEPGGVPREALASEFPGEASPTVDVFLVGPRMLLELLDPAEAFDIKPITPAEQSVQKGVITTWEWSVEPRRAGQHVLKLVATAVIGEDRTPYRVYDTEITVQANPPVTIRSFFAANWQAIFATLGTLGTLVLGVFTFAYSRKQRQAGKQRNGGDPTTPAIQ